MKTKTNTKPLYEHDCDSCDYLGVYEHTYEGEETVTYDLYTCRGRFPTVIARYSSHGPDYMSGLVFSRDPNSPLYEARIRAEERFGKFEEKHYW